MKEKNIFIGDSVLNTEKSEIKGKILKIEEEQYYQISNYDNMEPFLMSIVSDSDLWMYVSSNGGITAGRKNADNALFPYYTDDKIHDSTDILGSKTILLINKENKTYLWEPFSNNYKGLYSIKKNIYKSVYGNKVIFEEINQDLFITFRYEWKTSDKYGFVKHSTVINNNKCNVKINLLDGIQNILPYGINRQFQMQFSTLVDAYKKNELLNNSGIGIYALSSIPVDKPEPSEALKATVVWSTGFVNSKKLISSIQIDKFRKTGEIIEETIVNARRGAYFVNAEISLNPEEIKDWYIIADVNQDSAKLAELIKNLKINKTIEKSLEEDILNCTENLKKIVANSDGLQVSEDKLCTVRHFLNVLFNIMRGGIFYNNYNITKKDLILYLSKSNKSILENNIKYLNNLPENINYINLLDEISLKGERHLQRLCYEYLPLTYSRRHGDPSRPWNTFSIETKNEDGSIILDYAGNWRDIFQNWEALSLSFPGFVESMISKFVNASTADGYNPYRVTKDGIDWELPDSESPWTNIGYWGDHQIIYLLKLFEISHNYNPGKIEKLLNTNIFSYANVPYRIKSYSDLIINPRETINIDNDLQKLINKRVKELGSDGKLVLDNNNDIYMVNLTEKILVSILCKLSNFIPEAGIWLNTQRPEWNDANNALVGYGVSMVTLYYIRRYIIFFIKIFSNLKLNKVYVSEEVVEIFNKINATFKKYQQHLNEKFSDELRKSVMDELGNAGSEYRLSIYKQGFSGKKNDIETSVLIGFFKLTLEYIDHSIKANKRLDNLYHSYNLMTVKDEIKVSIRYLYEMLEGQVALLSSGFLNTEESIELLDSLKNSRMFREDQYSYMLYPERKLPKFLEKNNIPSDKIKESALFQKLIDDKNTKLIIKDINGICHFNCDFRNSLDVINVLFELKNEGYEQLVEKEHELILDIFEQIFDHKSFTGRSGTFYGYEGLGCIYWHMVSKFLLAIEETFFRAYFGKEDGELLSKLKEYYYEVQKGIGLDKSPGIYGAFPIDPYSHTPGNGGAKQPGMTGQVKEDIISRIGELGIIVKDGQISIHPVLLRKEEFLNSEQLFYYYEINGKKNYLKLKADSLCFTLCQVPVIYRFSDKHRIILTKTDNSKKEINGLTIDSLTSYSLFMKKQEFKLIEVFFSFNLM